ncbi:MAG: TlpA family protein disulfide reductase [Planctomycetes bacterium]|nr:TlpA family protein disulfide reductase [Planctomycetota bacterium]
MRVIVRDDNDGNYRTELLIPRGDQPPAPGPIAEDRGGEAKPGDDQAAPRPAPAPGTKGAKFVDFTAKGLDGKEFKLSDFRGKVIILDFWATWCPPCRAEIPHFKELAKEYGPKGLVVIGVSDEERATVAKFADANGINYVMGLAKYQKFGAPYNKINAIPTTFVIAPDGAVVEHFVGSRPKAVFEALVKKHLPRPTEPAPTPAPDQGGGEDF